MNVKDEWNFCIGFLDCAALAQIGHKVQLGANHVQQILCWLPAQKCFANSLVLCARDKAYKAFKCSLRFCIIAAGEFDAENAF